MNGEDPFSWFMVGLSLGSLVMVAIFAYYFHIGRFIEVMP